MVLIHKLRKRIPINKINCNLLVFVYIMQTALRLCLILRVNILELPIPENIDIQKRKIGILQRLNHFQQSAALIQIFLFGIVIDDDFQLSFCFFEL